MSSNATANPANQPSNAFFAACGIEPGMRVLDIGCGTGELSRTIARLVGENGEVVGIDRDTGALNKAGEASGTVESAPIAYRNTDLSGELPDIGTFDAIVGRRVLMYLPDAEQTLRRLTRLTRPNAVMAFQEHGRANLPASAIELPVHRRLYDWVWDTVAAEGGDVCLAFKLSGLLRTLKASAIQERVEGIVLSPNTPSFLPTLAKLMWPRFVESGIIGVGDMQIDSFSAQIEKERDAISGPIVWDLAFLVSARIN
ncbi:MAG: methyltransferase domain-containing protein [Pseudomonadota bacterium]